MSSPWSSTPSLRLADSPGEVDSGGEHRSPDQEFDANIPAPYGAITEAPEGASVRRIRKIHAPTLPLPQPDRKVILITFSGRKETQ